MPRSRRVTTPTKCCVPLATEVIILCQWKASMRRDFPLMIALTRRRKKRSVPTLRFGRITLSIKCCTEKTRIWIGRSAFRFTGRIISAARGSRNMIQIAWIRAASASARAPSAKEMTWPHRLFSLLNRTNRRQNSRLFILSHRLHFYWWQKSRRLRRKNVAPTLSGRKKVLMLGLNFVSFSYCLLLRSEGQLSYNFKGQKQLYY